MLNISVSFFNVSSKFVQTFCPICQQASACSMFITGRDDFNGNATIFNIYICVIITKLTVGSQN